MDKLYNSQIRTTPLAIDVFNKKDFDSIKEELASLKSLAVSQQQMIDAQSQALSALRSDLATRENTILDRLDRLSNIEGERARQADLRLGEFDRLNSKYSGALENLKLIREGLVDRLGEKIEKDFHSKIFEHTERLKTDAMKYDALKTNLTGVANTLSILTGEIDKFNRISQKLSEKDFELGSYIRHVEKHDKHKLELMREIDRLQRLVGRMRQGGR